mmetsp:Transcript_47819/g.126575  ORF Transcript_47819/g.126575 Transcript_47819/m.126575 type:complete len:350 (-) Transcript_47819:332-1381(-)|eukprot:CAMPEP_0194481642 /NCGR_PEP_ID=MMETSP0253-20130528/3968_1 /TAXON_ID=2966 /ORGANISM="Noctiluca scintillans" /LENGTH=349 /DNA_ID=CAMNT_0039321139 /DNA_START=68 /DNA_END=1117 /DNA_ORIENTATION=+
MGCQSSSSRDVGAPRNTPDHQGDDKKAYAMLKEEQLAEFVKRGAGKHLPEEVKHEKPDAQKAKPEPLRSSRASKSGGMLNIFRSSRTTPRDSQFEYASRDQTIIIFDWDDTLLPSSWMRDSPLVDEQGHLRNMSDMSAEVHETLRAFMLQVVAVLSLALELGMVVIVTNARRPWVDISCRTFLPDVKPLMRKIPVLYGLELIDSGKGKMEEKGIDLTETKVRAMKSAVTKFYSRYENQSWKNVLSIGDAFFEHDAVLQVVRERPEYTGAKKCRVKTVKLLESPSISGLQVQLKILQSWLGSVVTSDKDVSIDFGGNADIGEQLAAVIDNGAPQQLSRSASKDSVKGPPT